MANVCGESERSLLTSGRGHRLPANKRQVIKGVSYVHSGGAAPVPADTRRKNSEELLGVKTSNSGLWSKNPIADCTPIRKNSRTTQKTRPQKTVRRSTNLHVFRLLQCCHCSRPCQKTGSLFSLILRQIETPFHGRGAPALLSDILLVVHDTFEEFTPHLAIMHSNGSGLPTRRHGKNCVGIWNW